MLRDYQSRMITATRESLLAGNKAVCLTAPTGAGKTHVAAEMILKATERGKSVLFLAPRRELIYQLSRKLDDCEIRYGVIMAGEPPSLYQRVQVASIPTLHSRRKRMQLPSASLVIVDEAHLGINGRSQELIEHYKNAGATVIGLTATPARTDGKALGALYDDLVLGPDVAELMAGGYLVPARYFAGQSPDLNGIKLTAGEYNQRELGERTNKPKLVGDVVSNWMRIAGDRQTFVFAVNVAHSLALREEFASVGIEAEHIDGKTPLDERAEIMRRLTNGDIQVLVNVGVMTYGVDFPPVSCIVMACPTKSVVKYMQCIGRGLRISENKADCMVLDHGGCIENPDLGFVDDPRPWSLDGSTSVQERQSAAKKEPKPIECPQCKRLFAAARVCPGCGHEMGGRYTKAIEALEAELLEVDQEKKRHQRKWSMDEKIRLFAELEGYRMKHRYRQGWTANKYRERVGTWPNDPRIRNAGPKEPSAQTQAWIRHTAIKWHKSKANAK